MTPRIGKVLVARYWTMVAIRVGVAGVLVWSVTKLLLLFMGLLDFDTTTRVNWSYIVGEGRSALTPAGIGLLVWAMGPWIVSKLLPVPAYACPLCMYPASGDRCPECGTALDEEDALQGPPA